MRLSPSQSRLAASYTQSRFLGTFCLLLLAPRAATSITTQNGPDPGSDSSNIELDVAQQAYEPAFEAFDRTIVGRAPLGVTALQNNVPESLNLSPGTTACYVVEKSTIFGTSSPSRRQADGSDGGDDDGDEGKPTTDVVKSRTIYLSANACLQPRSTQKDEPTAQPPQLFITISQSKDGGCARTLSDVPEDEKKSFQEGAVMFQVNATNDVYVGIVAPDVDKTKFGGIYNFEVAASTDTYYHTYNSSNAGELLWMDSDSSAVLLVTRALTNDPSRFQTVMKSNPPYMLYAENEARNFTGGLRASVCGLKNNAQILSNWKQDGMLNQLCQTGMTTRGPGGLPKQQFYFQGLNATSSYIGILYKPPAASSGKRDVNAPGGGGTVFPAVNFQTVQGKNCKVPDGGEFEFCDEVNWAMPGNDKLNNTELVKVYDNYARDMYANFEKVLAQIPCEAPPDQQYSLARNCSDCERAYKRWLCTVSIPRCEDISSSNPHAVLRNVGQPFPNGTMLSQEIRDSLGQNIYFNGSRNQQLDSQIQPGPYKEILPCDDICYEVVQSCPAAMQFSCPRPGWYGFNISYAERGDPNDQQLKCSFPGQSRTRVSMAVGIPPPVASLMTMFPLAALFVMLF